MRVKYESSGMNILLLAVLFFFGSVTYALNHHYGENDIQGAQEQPQISQEQIDEVPEPPHTDQPPLDEEERIKYPDNSEMIEEEVGIELEEAAEPIHLAIPAHSIEAGIDLTGPDYGSNRFNPARGRIHFWSEPETAKPCELGSSFMLGHVTDVFGNLTTGPQDNRDDGVVAGSEVIVTLEDGTLCIFEVIEFDLPIGEPVPDTPAHRVGKDEWANTLWQEAIDLTKDRSLLFLLTSGGTEFQTINGSNHRVHADVVMAELVDVQVPAG